MSGRKNLKAVLAGGAGALALMTASVAAAQTRDYDVPAGDLIVALNNLALWMPIGLVLGLVIGSAMGRNRRGDA